MLNDFICNLIHCRHDLFFCVTWLRQYKPSDVDLYGRLWDVDGYRFDQDCVLYNINTRQVYRARSCRINHGDQHTISKYSSLGQIYESLEVLFS